MAEAADPNDPQPRGKPKFDKSEFEQLKAYYKKLGLELNDTMDQFIKKMGGSEGALKHLRKMHNGVIDLKRDLGGAVRELTEITGELKQGNQWLKESIKATNKITQLTSELRDDQQGISELEEKRLKTIVESLQKERLRLINAREMGDLSDAQKQNIKDALDRLEESLEVAEERLALEKHITKQMGLGGAAIKGLTKLFDKLGISGVLSIDEIGKKMRDVAKEGGSKGQVLKAGFVEAFKSVGEALRDPLVQITLFYKAMEGLVKSAIAYQTKIFDISKTLGMGVTQTGAMFNNFKQIAWQNGKLAMTGKQLAESYGKVNEQLGFIGPRNAEFLTFATGIERRLGLGAADMENMYAYAASTGKSIKETYGSVVATTKMHGMRLGFQMTEKQIMQAISKVSATIFNNFKGNVKQLAMAVQTATKFGTTLDQINSAGMQMLNFEDSISKEFEAQLLTGRKIDLSKARQAALTGDTATLMGEITRQLGSQAQWNNMNVIQQQSLAEAFGMSKEAVDEMYRKQQLVNALGKEANADSLTQYNMLVAQGKSRSEIAQLIGQQAVSDAMAASVQDKMAATMERIQDAIGEMSSALLPLIDWFANLISNADTLRNIFVGIAGVAGLLVGYSLELSRQKSVQLATEMQLRRMQTAALLTQNRILATETLKTAEGTAQIAQKTTQLGQTELQQIAETGLAETRIVGAGASVTAGSGYLGPGALAVGLAAMAGLSAYLMTSGMGGGGGSVPTPSTGINPMNTAAANASNQENLGNVISTAGAQRPVNVTFQAQVVDTPTNMSGRFDRGISMDQTVYTGGR